MLTESYFKNATESSADAIIITDPYGVIQYANPAFTNVTGWSTEEAIGKTPQILKSGKTPESVFQEMWATLHRGETWRGRLINKRKSRPTAELPIMGQNPKPREDDFYWAHMSISPMLDAQGENIAYISTHRDISYTVTQENQRKRERDDATARAAIAVVLQEQHPLKDRIKNSLTLLMGLEGLEIQNKGGVFLTSEEQDHLDLFVTNGKFSEEFFAKEKTIPKGFCLCGRAAVSGEMIVSDDCFCDPRHEQTFEGMKAHGHYIVPLMHENVPVGIMFLYTDPYPVRDGTRLQQLQSIGELMGVAIANDRLNQKLEKEKKRAESSNRAKSQFLANMSHEIRTPLNGILGFADVLAQHGESLSQEEQAEYLSHIQTSGQHLLTLINDILDLSKIESDKVELEKLDYSPHALLAEVTSLMRVRAKEKGLTLDSQWKGPLPAAIHTDPTRLRQVLVNLVGNAIKFTQEGGVRLVASIEQQEDGTNQLCVDVIDSGMGIPQDKQDLVFAPFSQADSSVTRKFGGTGLGLTISRQLAQALGGDLTMESCVGFGSTFSVTVDAGSLQKTEMLSSPPGDGVGTPDQSSGAASQKLNGARILLVEDGEINQKLIVALLTQAGVTTIDIAENGEIGVCKATERDYDLILLDMQMPVMDGYTAAATLRERGNPTPILALTAHAMKGDKEKCIDAGCNDYLSKPIVAENLIRKIASWLPASASQEEASKVVSLTGADKKIGSTLPVGNPVFLEIVQDFGDFLEESLPRMQEAAGNEQAEQLKSLAHNLLGTAGGAGFGDFTQPAKELETLASECRYAEAVEVLGTIQRIAARIDIPARAITSGV